MTPEREKFWEELEALLRRHNISISHQDFQGSFILEPFTEYNWRWLREAEDCTEEATS
jgi:hypothetical protein